MRPPSVDRPDEARGVSEQARSSAAEQRHVALRALRVLGGAADARLAPFVRIAVELTSAAVVLVVFFDGDAPYVKASHGVSSSGSANFALPPTVACGDGEGAADGEVGLELEGVWHPHAYRVSLVSREGLFLGALVVAGPRALQAGATLSALRGVAEQLVARLELERDREVWLEEKLALSTYRRFFEVAPDLLCEVDSDGRVSTTNSAWERVLGWTCSQLSEKALTEWVHVDDRDELVAALADARAEVDPFVYVTTRAATPAGVWVSLQWRFSSRDGIVHASARDVSAVEAHRAEIEAHQRALVEQQRKLSASEARIRGLFDAMAEGVIVQASDGTIESCNPAARRILGRESTAILGQRDDEDLWPVTSDEITNACQVPAPLALAFATSEQVSNAVREIRRPDGRRVWVSINAQPLIEDGADSPGAVVATFRDISEQISTRTALQQAEASLRALVDTAVDTIAVMDCCGRVERANPAIISTFGFLPEEVVGTNVRALLNGEVRRGEMRRSDLPNGESPIQAGAREVVARRKDGTSFFAELTLSEFQVAGETKFTGIFRDISERKRIENELRELTATAERASQAKTEFLANMSHEIRTPMNAILGMGELLADSGLGAVQRTYVDNLRRAGEHLLDVINDVLDVAKIEAGKLTLEDAPFSLRTLAEDVCELLAPKAAPGVELVCRVSPEVAEEVFGDSIRLRQVIFNLVGNALKFTRRGQVVLGVARSRGAPGRYDLSVTDSGTGIPAHRLEAIFDSFTQADNSTTRTHGGTGLGLTISKAIVEKMGGSLEVESEEGRGSRFSFSIALGSGSSTARWANPLGDALTGRDVLVFLPNEAQRAVAREILESFDAVVSESERLEESVSRIRRASRIGRPFEVVLVDVAHEGVELASALAAEGLGCRALLLLHRVGDALPSDAEAERLGITAFLAKPVRRAETAKVLAGAVRARNASSQPGVLANRPTGGPLAAPGQTAEVATESWEPLTVLVADDVAVNREIIAAFLKGLPFTIEQASDGRRAVELAKSRPYDLIFMDIQMPEMDGYSATRAIRAHEMDAGLPRTPIVAMTAHAMPEEVKRCLAAGCDAHCSKPISRARLLTAIRENAVRSERHSEPSAPLAEPLDPELAALLPTYLQSCREQVSDARNALGVADFVRISRIGHNLKGTGAVFGLSEVSAIGSRLEALAEHGAVASIRGELEQLAGLLVGAAVGPRAR